jgi:hypothetical protein
MVNPKNLAAESLAISIIRRVVSTLASLLLIISIASPFCSVGASGYFGIVNAKQGAVFWSYRSDFYYSSGILFTGPPRRQYWFFDYWFSYLNRDLLKLAWMILPMFILQVLTLVFGIISIISNRRILSLAPVCFSVIVPALIIYTINRLFEIAQFGNYEQGYYFSYYSVGLFLSAFVLNEVTENFPKYNVRALPRTLCRHRGKVATVVAEGLEAPISINYLVNLRDVASDPLVAVGLNVGKVIKYPFRPEICSLAPHLVDTAGQYQMSPQFETNPMVSGILNLSRNPMAFGIAFGAAIAAPFVVYGVYRIYDHYHKQARTICNTPNRHTH